MSPWQYDEAVLEEWETEEPEAVRDRRRLRCLLGLHRWQYLLAPPWTYTPGDRYEPGIWCIFCGRRWWP